MGADAISEHGGFHEASRAVLEGKPTLLVFPREGAVYTRKVGARGIMRNVWMSLKMSALS